jgi:uncharacterized protein
MKKQSIFLLRASIAFTFMSTLLLITSCEQAQTQQQNSAAQTKPKPPKVDIHTAVVTDNMEALKQHIAAGSDLNEKDPMGGSSPLISACLFGKTAMAKTLIDAGANINFQNNDGSTPLITAAFFCRPEIVKLLLAKNADKTIKNKYGQTAYETVSSPFATVKPVYDALGKMLAPMGLKFDYAYMEKTRPEIAAMLK